MPLTDEELFRKHAPGLRRLAIALVGPAEGDDIFASAITRVLGSRTWHRLDDDARVRYLCRTITNEARRWGSRNSRQHRRDAILAARRTVAPEMDVDDSVWEAIATLSARQRAVVFLTYYDDLDTSEVANRLGISPGSVYQHLHRARRALERRLDV